MRYWIIVTGWYLVQVAQACPVCFKADEASRHAYVGTTVFMTMLPPALVGGFLTWLWRRSKSLEQ